MQFDEKWSYVAKKEKHCDPNQPADPQQGDNWDPVAFDPERRNDKTKKADPFADRLSGVPLVGIEPTTY